MNSNGAELLLTCPHCGEAMLCDAQSAGQEFSCPACQEMFVVPVAPPVIESPLPETKARKWSRLPLVAGSMLAGALLGFALVGGPGSMLIGSLVGFLVAWRIAEVRSGQAGEAVQPSRFPNALLGFILSVGAWGFVVLMWGWVMTRPPATFHDQGGMIITFLVLPLTFICWVIGGPVAVIVSRQGLKQIQSAARPESDRWLARTGNALSWLMSLTLFGFLLWIIVANVR